MQIKDIWLYWVFFFHEIVMNRLKWVSHIEINQFIAQRKTVLIFMNQE